MKDYELELRQRILELEKGLHSILEIIPEEYSPAKINCAVAGYTNAVKIKALLEIYNKNFYNDEMIELEKENDEDLKVLESKLIGRLKQAIS